MHTVMSGYINTTQELRHEPVVKSLLCILPCKRHWKTVTTALSVVGIYRKLISAARIEWDDPLN